MRAHRRWFPHPLATMRSAEVKTIVRLGPGVAATATTHLARSAGIRRCLYPPNSEQYSTLSVSASIMARRVDLYTSRQLDTITPTARRKAGERVLPYRTPFHPFPCN